MGREAPCETRTVGVLVVVSSEDRPVWAAQSSGVKLLIWMLVFHRIRVGLGASKVCRVVRGLPTPDETIPKPTG